jgi:hypothetical protein
LQTVDGNYNVLGERAILRHTEDGVLVRLYFGIRPPVDIGIYHHLLTDPGLMHLIINLFDDTTSV